MNGSDIIQIVLIAGSYYLFSNEFFRFSAEIKGREVPYGIRFACFVCIYAWFVIASILELPLVVNWLVFLFLLGLEVRMVFSFDSMVSCALSMFSAIMGLAANVFLRSLAAIILKVPLSHFDQTLSYFKPYPIFGGFMFMGLLLYIMRRSRFSEQLKTMLYYRKSLVFYTWTEVTIYLFLIIQLLAFSQTGNELGIKTWGIKSAVFSGVVLMIATVYSLRVASLHYYMQRQHEVRDQLIQEKEDVNKLWELAYTDMLTGCSNRQLLDKRLEEYAGYGSSITLAFIDVNGLKGINDQYGHLEGDAYLISMVRILKEKADGRNIDLFRYGGDEFVMMSNTLGTQELTSLLTEVNEDLKTEEISYPRSISYGVVHGDCTDYQKLIVAADDIMYRYKLKHYEDMARS